jgi:hypothetical protein
MSKSVASPMLLSALAAGCNVDLRFHDAGEPDCAAHSDAAGVTTSDVRSRGSFVERHGAVLQLDGRPFRFAGANLYWLGLDENVDGVAPPTAFRVADGLDTALLG